MRDVPIVSIARTLIGKAFHGAFNDTKAPLFWWVIRFDKHVTPFACDNQRVCV